MSHFIVLRRNEVYNIRAIFIPEEKRIYTFIGLTIMESNYLVDVERYGRLTNLKCFPVDVLPADFRQSILDFNKSHGLDVASV